MSKVILDTSYGAITLELDDDNTPVTTQNFIEYVKEGFYNGTIFHRVIKNFMIQGGGFTSDMDQKETRETIKNEANKGGQNVTGTIAMARTPDPDSATAQFFINVADNYFLDFKSETPEGWGYCVFGKVTDGLDIVMKIAEVATTSRAGHNDVPEEPVVLQNVELIEELSLEAN